MVIIKLSIMKNVNVLLKYVEKCFEVLNLFDCDVDYVRN